MTWLKTIDTQELFALCPELTKVKTEVLKGPDDAVWLVREAKASRLGTARMPREMYPTSDPHDFNELMRSRTREYKDYDQDNVKQFDEVKNSYWDRVKKEIRLLICTKDKKYSELRKRLSDAGKHSKAPVVGMISATLASSMGVAVGVISGLVAVAIFAILQIGINAYCAAAS